MNLDFAKVCGRHSAIYEAYYKQIDPKGSGAIEAMTAAKFLKKSGLSDVVLSRIWDLSDPNGKGFLDKPGFFVALKLVSVAQSGQVVNMSNIYTETPNPPKVGDLPKILPPRIQTVPVSSGGVANGDWSISVIDRLKYEQLFESLKPVGGMLPGNKVKGVLMDSKLPMDTLGKIWDLADQDKDGNLDKHEFLVAMHLVYQTLEKRTVPDVLPVELRKPGAAGGGVPPPKPAPPAVGAAMPRAPSGEGFGDGGFVANFPKDIAPPPAVVIPTLPAIPRIPVAIGPLISTADPLVPIGAPPSVTANADWVVTAAELKRFEVIFRDSDRDKDGLVSGLEVKNVFLQSGVPQNCLAHIWALCDTNQSGKLTLEQFALAMWMVERKQNGIEPPQVLTANMVPPSMRATVSGIDIQPQEPKPAYSNPELEMISKEIEELAKERRSLETEIAQKEADIRIKSGEVRSLQSELDTLSATLKQLENQRGEAQKRLDDLKAQSTEFEAYIANLNLELSRMRNQVNKIREQSQKQEETINEQEGELNAKRSELQKLKDEETALQKEYDENNRELQKLTQHLQNTQLQISSVRSMVTQLMETQRQMTDALIMCRAAIENQDGELVTEYQLKIEPDFDEARRTLEKRIDEPKVDPFEDNRAATKNHSNGFASNGFGNDPFGADSTTTTGATSTISSTTMRGGFDDSFNATRSFDSGFDAFGSGGGSGSGAFGQPKDPFGADTFGSNKTNEPVKDDFDPFAALHAPTGQGQVLSPNAQKSGPPPRPESPSPALPPKKSKVPPPRPAPPRPIQGPARPAQPAMDAFGSSTGGSGFADFADFDNKLSLTSAPAAQSSDFSMLFDAKSFATTNTTALPSTSTTIDTIINKVAPTATNTFAECSSNSSKLQSTSASSASPSSSSFSSLNNLTNSHMSNNLTRSITPLQQAAANAFSTAATTATITETAAANKSAVVRGPTDFSDDPFKDYRYEDPFNIKDPFADDGDDDDNGINDPEKFFQDSKAVQVVGDDKAASLKTSTNLQDPNPGSCHSVKAITPLSHEFIDKFEAFTTNPSPVPSHKSSNSTGISAFQDMGTSSQRNTPVPAVTIASADAFADFDAFAVNATTATGSTGIPATRVESPFGGLKPFGATSASKTPEDIQNSNAEPKANDSFYDAFSDKFNSNTTKDIKSTTTTTTSASIFDAFGDTKTPVVDPFLSTTTSTRSLANAFGDAFTVASATSKPASNLFDDFNDNAFEDDFFRTQMTTNDDNNKNKTNKVDGNMDFAKFDVFDDFKADFSTSLNNAKNMTHNKNFEDGSVMAVALPSLVKVQNQTTLTKKQNLSSADNGGGVKLPEKFVADYSKAETFEDDIQEAIRRSMIDQ